MFGVQPMQRSQTFYEPSPRKLTSISVNNPPPRDTYSGYGARNEDPRSIYQQSFFPFHRAGGAGAREDDVMAKLARDLNGYVLTSYFFSLFCVFLNMYCPVE